MAILAVVNPLFPDNYRSIISNRLGENIIFVNVEFEKKFKYPLFFHPDVVGAKFDNNFFACANLSNSFCEKLKNCGISVIRGDYIKPHYPFDSAFNCVIGKDFIFHNLSITDQVILDFADSKGFFSINVKQGYSKCSTVVLNNNFLITDDKGIYKKILKHFNVLLVSRGDIKLDGYNYGFIGGATAVYNNYIFVFGCLENHRDYISIKSFAESVGYKVVNLGEGKLEDYGGIHFFKCNPNILA